ncbi:MAG: BT4734/BF3469 family protein [Prevotella sp.]|nr:BT4734/BF3469 family protein [Prevotella sp.]
MFSIQRNLLRPTEACSRQDFYGAFGDKRVKQIIADIRQYEKTLSDPTAPPELRKEAEKRKSALKKGLPGMLFQATFVETKSKKGSTARWRKQSAAILNGLYMCDFDHIDDPRKVYASWGGEDRLRQLGVMLCYVTPSGHGMKLVARADIGKNLIDNARWLASQLGMETDEACKDASRLSFISTLEDILFIDEKIFEYDNNKFEEKYGAAYRSGDSSGNLFANDSTSGHENSSRTDVGAGTFGKQAPAVGRQEIEGGVLNNGEGNNNTEEPVFCGVPYKKIVEEYVNIRGGNPATGSRHTWLLSMARNFRYICDFNAGLLLQVLTMSKAGADILSEGGRAELEGIVDSNLHQPTYDGYPKYIRLACQGCGIKLGANNPAGVPVEKASIDYHYWWNRLQPLLDGGYKDACTGIADENKLGAVLSAGAMYGTYLTKCWWQHYDGHPYRLSYMVYVIGDPASGKSFVIRQDEAIMKLLRDQDAAGREWEAKVKEENEKRQQSSKEAKKDALPVVHPVIRYVPSSISNAVFYRRSMAAKAEVQGKEMHLHLYTMESELATALRAQVGSWAGKHDIELKSFQNEYAGVDFANQQSVNGIIQCNWNQVVTTTMDGVREKLAKGSINDGFITRLAIWVMPSNNYTMIERSYGKKTVDNSALERWGYILQDFEGEIEVPKLVDYCYDWCARQCEIAALEDDYLIDYFRKRVPIYMMRYTIPRIVMREYANYAKTRKWTVKQSDLDFAQLIGDYLMYIQIYLFGSKIEQARDKQLEDARPRLKKSKFQAFYDSLGDTFTIEEFGVNYKNEDSANVILRKLKNMGVVKQNGKGKFQKLVDSLANVTTVEKK